MGVTHGYLPPHHFDQIYTAHGTFMLFFAATPMVAGLGNIIVPLQLGARDMAFPYLNAVSLWLTIAGAALCMISLFVGEFSNATWVGLMPFSEMSSNPGVGVDYWMWAFQISSIATTFNSINMITTIVKMRAPGMTWFRMPVYCWSSLATNIIGLTAFPVSPWPSLCWGWTATPARIFSPPGMAVISCSTSTCSGSGATLKFTS